MVRANIATAYENAARRRPRDYVYTVNIEVYKLYPENPEKSFKAVETYANLEQANASARQCALFGHYLTNWIPGPKEIQRGECSTLASPKDTGRHWPHSKSWEITRTERAFDEMGCLSYTASFVDHKKLHHNGEPKKVRAFVKAVALMDSQKPITAETRRNRSKFLSADMLAQQKRKPEDRGRYTATSPPQSIAPDDSKPEDRGGYTATSPAQSIAPDDSISLASVRNAFIKQQQAATIISAQDRDFSSVTEVSILSPSERSAVTVQCSLPTPRPSPSRGQSTPLPFTDYWPSDTEPQIPTGKPSPGGAVTPARSLVETAPTLPTIERQPIQEIIAEPQSKPAGLPRVLDLNSLVSQRPTRTRSGKISSATPCPSVVTLVVQTSSPTSQSANASASTQARSGPFTPQCPPVSTEKPQVDATPFVSLCFSTATQTEDIDSPKLAYSSATTQTEGDFYALRRPESSKVPESESTDKADLPPPSPEVVKPYKWSIQTFLDKHTENTDCSMVLKSSVFWQTWEDPEEPKDIEKEEADSCEVSSISAVKDTKNAWEYELPKSDAGDDNGKISPTLVESNEVGDSKNSGVRELSSLDYEGDRSCLTSIKSTDTPSSVGKLPEQEDNVGLVSGGSRWLVLNEPQATRLPEDSKSTALVWKKRFENLLASLKSTVKEASVESELMLEEGLGVDSL
ncbi:hypothetical protein BJ508DRAFT_362086 [Ascobolus immersus RN42]|uniref:Uncharacterized protein n=1 Tax=Ascobolus immersus RN42 TaxID=1160509 RepID=A0A3N4I5D2_ASCIM|nr:hypothetical protein BJ508DRAFT_362086 [Ascobolus immersus RN42]